MTSSGSKKREYEGGSITFPPSVPSVNGGEHSIQSGKVSNKLNPAEMLSQYKNASLEFGATKSGDRRVENDDKDCSNGAYRLARELDQFIVNGLDAALAASQNFDSFTTPGESISDLQLHSARKLRQVRLWLLSRLRFCSLQYIHHSTPKMCRLFDISHKWLISVSDSFFLPTESCCT